MTLLSLCDQPPAAVAPTVTAADAIEMMFKYHVGAVAVVDDQGRVAGIFTERDVLRKLALSGRDPQKTPVLEVMTTPVEMATVDTTPGDALAVMLERHYRHLPIVDHDAKLLGVLSIRNLLQARVDELVEQLDAVQQGRA